MFNLLKRPIALLLAMSVLADPVSGFGQLPRMPAVQPSELSASVLCEAIVPPVLSNRRLDRFLSIPAGFAKDEAERIHPAYSSAASFFQQYETWRAQNPKAQLVVFLRHAETRSNIFESIQDYETFSPLTIRGRQQVRRFRRFMREIGVSFDRYLAPDIERPYETLLPAARDAGKKIEIRKRFREARIQPIGGISWSQGERLFPGYLDKFTADPHSFQIGPFYAGQKVRKYGRLFSSELTRAAGQNIIVASSGMTILLLVMDFLGIPSTKYKPLFQALGNPKNAAFTILSYEPGAERWRLLVYGDNSYLPPEIREKTAGAIEKTLNKLRFAPMAAFRWLRKLFRPSSGHLYSDYYPNLRMYWSPADADVLTAMYMAAEKAERLNPYKPEVREKRVETLDPLIRTLLQNDPTLTPRQLADALVEAGHFTHPAEVSKIVGRPTAPLDKTFSFMRAKELFGTTVLEKYPDSPLGMLASDREPRSGYRRLLDDATLLEIADLLSQKGLGSLLKSSVAITRTELAGNVAGFYPLMAALHSTESDSHLLKLEIFVPDFEIQKGVHRAQKIMHGSIFPDGLLAHFPKSVLSKGAVQRERRHLERKVVLPPVNEETLFKFMHAGVLHEIGEGIWFLIEDLAKSGHSSAAQSLHRRWLKLSKKHPAGVLTLRNLIKQYGGHHPTMDSDPFEGNLFGDLFAMWVDSGSLYYSFGENLSDEMRVYFEDVAHFLQSTQQDILQPAPPAVVLPQAQAPSQAVALHPSHLPPQGIENRPELQPMLRIVVDRYTEIEAILVKLKDSLSEGNLDQAREILPALRRDIPVLNDQLADLAITHPWGSSLRKQADALVHAATTVYTSLLHATDEWLEEGLDKPNSAETLSPLVTVRLAKVRAMIDVYKPLIDTPPVLGVVRGLTAAAQEFEEIHQRWIEIRSVPGRETDAARLYVRMEQLLQREVPVQEDEKMGYTHALYAAIWDFMESTRIKPTHNNEDEFTRGVKSWLQPVVLRLARRFADFHLVVFRGGWIPVTARHHKKLTILFLQFANRAIEEFHGYYLATYVLNLKSHKPGEKRDYLEERFRNAFHMEHGAFDLSAFRKNQMLAMAGRSVPDAPLLVLLAYWLKLRTFFVLDTLVRHRTFPLLPSRLQSAISQAYVSRAIPLKQRVLRDRVPEHVEGASRAVSTEIWLQTLQDLVERSRKSGQITPGDLEVLFLAGSEAAPVVKKAAMESALSLSAIVQPEIRRDYTATLMTLVISTPPHAFTDDVRARVIRFINESIGTRTAHTPSVVRKGLLSLFLGAVLACAAPVFAQTIAPAPIQLIRQRQAESVEFVSPTNGRFQRGLVDTRLRNLPLKFVAPLRMKSGDAIRIQMTGPFKHLIGKTIIALVVEENIARDPIDARYESTVLTSEGILRVPVKQDKIVGSLILTVKYPDVQQETLDVRIAGIEWVKADSRKAETIDPLKLLLPLALGLGMAVSPRPNNASTRVEGKSEEFDEVSPQAWSPAQHSDFYETMLGLSFIAVLVGSFYLHDFPFFDFSFMGNLLYIAVLVGDVVAIMAMLPLLRDSHLAKGFIVKTRPRHPSVWIHKDSETPLSVGDVVDHLNRSLDDETPLREVLMAAVRISFESLRYRRGYNMFFAKTLAAADAAWWRWTHRKESLLNFRSSAIQLIRSTTEPEQAQNKSWVRLRRAA